MATTQSAYDWLREKTKPEARLDAHTRAPPTRPGHPSGPRHEHDARAEIDRLLENVEDLVSIERRAPTDRAFGPRSTRSPSSRW